MKKLLSLLMVGVTFIGIGLPTLGIAHEMQHGFILSDSDQYASHLVANGHHSWQASISGELNIGSSEDRNLYLGKKTSNSTERKTYFLFQAQRLDLPSIKAGQILSGHIIESKVGDYEPKNVIVRDATFTVGEVQINLVNPFFQ